MKGIRSPRLIRKYTKKNGIELSKNKYSKIHTHTLIARPINSMKSETNDDDILQ